MFQSVHRHLRYFVCRSYQSLSILKLRLIRFHSTMTFQTARVRCVADDNMIQLSFPYTNDVIQERVFSFNRSKEESIGTVFGRIKKNIETVRQKKFKKNKCDSKTDEPQVHVDEPVKLEDETGCLIPEETLNDSAWKAGSVLSVGDKRYKIVVNSPTVKSLSLPKNVMAGFHITPKVSLEFANKEDSVYKWYRKLNKDEQHCDEREKPKLWKHVGTGYHFMTSNTDVGRELKVICEPRSGSVCGQEVEAVTQTPVSAGPGPCPFEERHLYTQDEVPDHSFRVVSYNILADLYADSDHTRTVLFPYCPPYALDADYRKQLLIREILGYCGDVICLQEVDSKLFKHDLQPLMLSMGLDGHFLVKGGKVVEGLACFTKQRKFRVVESGGFILASELETNPLFADIYNKVCDNEKLKERILARTTAMQVMLLESTRKPGSMIILGNTHLYFRPDSDHIRLLQATICIRYLENKLQECQKQWPDCQINVMLCGDFNSCPEFGVLQLMTTGSVPETSMDWKSAPEETINGLSVSQGLDLASACGTPAYTNYTSFFNGCLDYIFYQPSALSLESVVPLPTHEQVTQHVALPSLVFPSDHLALIATLKWKS